MPSQSTLSLSLLPIGLLVFAVTSTVAARAGDAPRVTSEQVAAAVEKLDKLAVDTLQQTGVPGIAVAVLHRGQVVLKRGYGVRAAGRPETIDADTVFQLASVSKPLTATVLARLVGEGRVGWDDRVVDCDPGFRMFDPYVTRELRLRDLLCHRSGLPDHGGDLLEDIGYERDEILRRLRYLPPDSSFRARYAYTNFGFTEAAVAAARSVGQSWEDLARDQLFTPLGMNASSYRFADYERAANRVLAHVKVDGRWTPKFTRQPDAQSPAGGASMSLNDVVRWLQLLLDDGQLAGKPLIDAAALAETHAPQIVTGFDPALGRVVTYGLGWIVSTDHGGRVFLKHSGGFALGVRTEVALLKSEGLAIAVFCNAAPNGVPEGLTESFFDWALEGELSRNWVEFANRMFDEEAGQELGSRHDYSRPPATPTAPLALAAYTGRYANDFFGPIEVAAARDQLVLKLGPGPQEFALRHWDRDTFVYQPAGENAGGLAGVFFTIDPTGQASTVLIENLNLHGQGEFGKQK